MTTPERAVARIDLGAVERNCRHLRSLLAPGARLCAVVKADGYGHGDVLCGRAAIDGGADWLAVATAAEAEELRRHGIRARILVMGALTREDARTALAAAADVVAWDERFVALLDDLARADDLAARVHVKLDTGMGRLGARSVDGARAVANAVEAAGRLELSGAMTHFATADEPDGDAFADQLERFAPFADELRGDGRLVHAANSAGTYRDSAAHFDMVRCGIAIYGLDPFHEDPSARGLEPALRLESYVAAVRRFEPGDSAGYGRRWRADRATWVGTLPIGYGDGWRRGLTNNADVLVRGRRYPLAGTVSMDNITIDLGPETDVVPGDVAVLIGADGDERILCEEVARRLDTINYEITCGLSSRVRRAHTRA
ncbi:MAG TPA: alanine racemase [Thermoleophilaceae bacterium]|nr:alanine racemase [Thermoleophilaceae bacterium]